jgi:hypothetical protein
LKENIWVRFIQHITGIFVAAKTGFASLLLRFVETEILACAAPGTCFARPDAHARGNGTLLQAPGGIPSPVLFPSVRLLLRKGVCFLKPKLEVPRDPLAAAALGPAPPPESGASVISIPLPPLSAFPSPFCVFCVFGLTTIRAGARTRSATTPNPNTTAPRPNKSAGSAQTGAPASHVDPLATPNSTTKNELTSCE